MNILPKEILFYENIYFKKASTIIYNGHLNKKIFFSQYINLPSIKSGLLALKIKHKA